MGKTSPSRIKVAYCNSNIDVASLAANTGAVSAAHAPTRNVRVVKQEIFVAFEGAGSDEFLVFGIADADYSLAEIEEALEGSGLNFDDKIARERAQRAVFPLAILGGSAVGLQSVKVEHDKPWTYLEDKGWQYFAYNLTEDAMGANTQKIEYLAKVMLVPL